MNKVSKLLPVLKHKLVIPILSIIALLAFGSMVVYQLTKAEVTVVQNDEETTVRTHANTVEELLEELNIEAADHDKLSHKLEENITSGMEVTYTKAKKVVVSIDGKEQEYYTTQETVGSFFAEKEMNFTEHDNVSLANNAAIENGLAIEIQQAFQVTVNDGGEEQTIWTTGGNVENLLSENNIKLGELDRLEPELTANLSKDTSISITRVEKVTDIIEESKDYTVVKKNDSSIDKGKEQVVSPGENGVITKTFEVTLENGKEVSRELVSEEVTKESEQRVVAVGTKEAVKATNYTVSRGDNGEAVKEFYMTATVYTEKCNGCRGITSTGIDLRNAPDKKVVAVDPRVIPLGSKVWVEGYGNAIAGDIGGAIKGNRIDLFVHSSKYGYDYGHRKVRVKVYGK
ncbi:ubiquitin-like domain-containing protein [Radiobacillus sp. PE A8.2]|uniref:ubiquitin-like domain-containing protein n=1 Tax=Radiobacillus sp. PE A8.2 TaxID=3380349 RepID=UPI00388DDCFD